MSSTAKNTIGMTELELEEKSALIDIHSPSRHFEPDKEEGNVKIDINQAR